VREVGAGSAGSGLAVPTAPAAGPPGDTAGNPGVGAPRRTIRHDRLVTDHSKPRTALEKRLTGLAVVTTELVGAEDLDAVTRAVTQHSADAAGATMASLTLRDGPSHLRLVGLRGGSEEDLGRYERFPLTTRTPSTDVVRSGRRLVLDPEEAAAAYPDLPGWDRGERTILSLPLRVPSGTIGAIALAFPGRRRLDDTELDFFEILADSCAQACARIEAQATAATNQAKLEFLATASAELSSSLDYTVTLANVARLAVPGFADWCGIDLLRDGRLDRLAVAHVDPRKVQLAQELHERYPSPPDAPSGPWQVIRSGRGELIAEITDEMLVAGARDEEHLRIARELQLHSAVTAPLTARGRTLGVITWVTAESGRRYTPEDAAFLEDLAKRAAVAIDNAELHSETAAMAARLQRAVLPAALPSVPGLEIAAHYSPAGRTDVGGDFYDVIPLTGGRVALLVGDVMGRGFAAAAAMAQVRASARAYIAVDPSPTSVLTNLDRLHAMLDDEQLVTLVYLLVDLGTGRADVANAGHPPAVLLTRAGEARQLDGSGVALGANDRPREQTTVSIGPGETLVLFTDGLVERRDENIDVGQGRLLRAAEVLLTGADLGPGLDALVTEVRDTSRDDDVAALAVRLTGGPVS
jgi:GAF domain-containing protein